jgi:fido (protein-threonine AMPylation protein)
MSYTLRQKRQEIIEFAKDRIEEIYDYDKDKVSTDNVYDLHHEIFNTDYYIVGRYQAKQWLGSDAFDCIAEIQEYENDHFGSVTTDLSEPERVVNMFVYIIGEQVLEDVISDFLDLQDDDEDEDSEEEDAA